MTTFTRYVSIGAESTYGVAVTPSTRFDIAGESLELDKDINFVLPERLIAPERTISRRRSVKGSIDVLLGFERAATILKWLFGARTTTAGGSGDYSHQFRPSLQRPASLTIDVPRDVQLHRYTGCTFTQARLSVGGPEHWGLALSVLGADETLTSIPSVNASDFEAPFWTLDPATAAPFTISLSDGVTTYDAPALGLDLDLAWNRILRTPERSETPVGIITRGHVRVRGRWRWLYGTDTSWLYTAFRNLSDLSITITWTGSLIGGSVRRKVEIIVPAARILGRTPTAKSAGSGNLEHEVPFDGLYSAAYEGPVQITVTNTTAAP